MELKSNPISIIEPLLTTPVKDKKKTTCLICNKHSSAKYLKEHGMCAKCYKIDQNIKTENNTRSVTNNTNKELNDFIGIIYNINKLCYDTSQLDKSYRNKLVDLNLAIDEFLVKKIIELNVKDTSD